jgi:putative ABC transport system permease protein
MNFLRTIWLKLRSLGKRGAVKQEIDEELRFHIEQRTAGNIDAGMTPGEAAREARKRFGNLQNVREECCEVHGANFGEQMLQDIHFGLRMLRKNPGFTVVAVLTLALGIGANTAIFTFVNSILLQPLPYHDAARLVRIGSVNPKLGVSDSRSSAPNIVDWVERSTLFEQLAAFQEWDGVLTVAGKSESTRVNWATANLLSMLGVKPECGRLPADDDAFVVLLSHNVWERFGGDLAMIGKRITVDGETATVIGVLPPNVAAPEQGARALDQVFLVANLRRVPWPRSLQLFNVVGRLKPGVTVPQAQAEMNRVATQLEREFPDSNRGWGIQVTDLKTWETSFVRGQVLALYGATAIILLIACLNVSNLLLIRAEARRKELAIRAALGSTRWRLARQLLSESLILSFAGAAIGLLLAWWCQRTLLAVAPGSLGLQGAKLNLPVLASTFIATFIAAIFSGLFPALRLSRGNLSRTLVETGRSASPARSRHRLLNSLVVSQIAISTMLLIAAGLAVASLKNLARVDPGFATQNVICSRVGTFSKSANGERVLASLSALPGVQAVGGANIELLNDIFSNGIRITADDSVAPGGLISGTVDVWHVTPDFFSAVGIPLVAGRAFQVQDRHDVVMVNEALAKQFFPNQDALGRSIRVPWTNSPGSPKRIIGVVGSVRQRGVRGPEVPIYYMHYLAEDMDHLALAMRTTLPPEALVSAIRSAIQKIDPELVMNHVTTTREIVSRSLSGQRFAALLMSGFALLGLLLAVVGLYGVISNTVAQRTREIGVRIALGAQRHDVLWLVLSQGMRLVTIGIASGVLAALALTRAMTSLLFEVKPTDPITFVGVAVLFAVVALLACFLPACRAMKIDPTTALRSE